MTLSTDDISVRNDPHLIPPRIREGLDLYRDHGIPTGGFLSAVISNDLFTAVARADHKNIRVLRSIVGYIYNEFPQNAWGSCEKYKAWIEAKAAAEELVSAETDF